ncbi:MAG: MFS transporter [Lachnospiraceae bacterium]|nr:MFS transporter [Lachnospiraceae bacterium]
MSAQTKAKRGLLANAFNSSRWDSRIKFQNISKKEIVLGYFIGPWGMLLTNSIVNSYFNAYLTDVLGFTVDKGLWVVTFMALFPVVSKLIDAITNIIMGRLLDRTASRQGKTRPWVILSAPLVLISIVAMFTMPFTNVKFQAVWVVVTFNLYYAVAYTIWNMAKELGVALSTHNVKQRRTNAMSATLVQQMGTGVVSILFPTMLAAVTHNLGGGDAAKGYFYSMSFIGCIAVPLAFVQYFYTRERITEEHRKQPDAGKDGGAGLEVASFGTQLKACLSDKYWVVYIVTILLWNTIANVRNIALIYYSGWVISGNSYGSAASIQAAFQVIAMQPMFLGVFFVLPMMRKMGRRQTIWMGAILTIVGSVIAYFGAGSRMMIYAGSALAGFGNVTFSYLITTFLGDCIDHVEWKTKVRCDGVSSSFYGAVFMFAVGIAQGIFNLGLGISGYSQPEQIGVGADGIALYADQLPSAVSWINISYQGLYILLGLIMFIVFRFFFRIEDELPTVTHELEERRIAEYAALGMEYIPPSERERREIEEQEREAEEVRVRELKEKCAKRGLDFEKENEKVLNKRAAKKAKAEAKAAKQRRK